jgi:excinuclease ABC subunit A
MATPDSIIITGAREHNLKDLSVIIPKNKLVVFTGLSGSGKSSLAFDTLYAEGQRRYVESLSSYARQFLGVMQKPDVDSIVGLSPAISIDQKTTSHNPRSTVGTITEIYDYLRLLYARVGTQHCPDCNLPVTTQSVDEIVGKVEAEVLPRLSQPVRILLLAPVIRDRKGEFQSLFANLQKQGYSRARIDGTIYRFDEDIVLIKTNKHTIEVVIDRLTLSSTEVNDEDLHRQFRSRLTQGVETALKIADGMAVISIVEDATLDFPEKPKQMHDLVFSEKRSCSNCGRSFPELEPRLFSFNSPQGACPDCHGLGSILKIDIDKIIAPTLSLSEGAIIPFARVLSSDTWWARLVKTVAEDEGIDYRKTAYYDLTERQQQVLLHGSTKIYTVSGENRFGNDTIIQEKFEGFITNLERRYKETDSEFMRQEIGQFMRTQECALCHGKRLNEEALAVTIDDRNIASISNLAIINCQNWVDSIASQPVLTSQQKMIADSVLREISQRLQFLVSVGLDYLSLDRMASTLAGGEAQRIRLASQIGTGLSGVLYILDEPTIGLHPRDNHRLIETLKQLQQKGNTVIVVEHDRDVMLAADYLFDFGPGAGRHGGEIVSHGLPAEVLADKNSLTGKYLSRKKDVLREKN